MVVLKEVSCKMAEYFRKGGFDDSYWFMSKVLQLVKLLYKNICSAARIVMQLTVAQLLKTSHNNRRSFTHTDI